MPVVSRPHLAAAPPSNQTITVSYTADFGEWDVGDDNRVAFDADASTIEAAIMSAYSVSSTVDVDESGGTYTITIILPDSVTFTPSPIAISRGEILPLGTATPCTPTFGWNDIGGDPDEEAEPPEEGWGWDWGFDLDGANVGWVELVGDVPEPDSGLEGILIEGETWWASDNNASLELTCQDHGRPDAVVDGSPPSRRIYTETPGEAPTVPEITGTLFNVTAVADWSVT